MLLGIDVGGTFTDAVLVEGGKVISQAKRPTTHENIMEGLLGALDAVLALVENRAGLERVALSTTLITNAVAAGRLPEVLLAVMPGPGANCETSFPVRPVILPGYVDHRGEVAAPFLKETLPEIMPGQPVAVSGKFSVRNPANENKLAETISSLGIENIVMGKDMSGDLGFIRRTNSAYYTAATQDLLGVFMSAIQTILRERGITAPIYILKADGAAMPLDWARKHSVESFFTGPAASAWGVKALLGPEKRSISLDIGGTTTDIAFWDKTFPLLSRRGAVINGYPTSVRALHLKSVPLGGDSVVRRFCGALTIGPDRQGAAMALGGGQPTLTDAFLLLGKASFGDLERAEYAMGQLAESGESAFVVAGKVLNTAVDKLAAVVEQMLDEWAMQPVYRVDDIVAGSEFRPQVLIGVGGAAVGLAEALGEKLGLPVEIPENALVANAVGAAVARPAIMANLRANTALLQCHIAQAEKAIKIDKCFSTKEAEKLLREWLKEEAARQGVPYHGTETVWQEEFPVVRGAYRSGVIIDLAMQLSPGVLTGVKGGRG